MWWALINNNNHVIQAQEGTRSIVPTLISSIYREEQKHHNFLIVLPFIIITFNLMPFKPFKQSLTSGVCNQTLSYSLLAERSRKSIEDTLNLCLCTPDFLMSLRTTIVRGVGCANEPYRQKRRYSLRKHSKFSDESALFET